MDSAALQAHIEQHMDCDHIEVHSADNVHFEAIVVSAAFDGISKVKQQQLVYTALGNKITSGEVHALALKTYTPEGWQAQQ